MTVRGLRAPRFIGRIVLVGAFLLTGPAPEAQIVVNEVMYNSPGAPDVEFVELYNAGMTAQDLTGWYLLDDNNLHAKCFLAGTLQPGDYLVVAGDLALFNTVYPAVTQLNPNAFLGFTFGNSGDQVRVFDQLGGLVDIVPYSDDSPWPTESDGNGPSLELLHPGLDNSLSTSWSFSVDVPPNGTPAALNSVFVPTGSPIVTNVMRSVPLPTSSDSVSVSAQVDDNDLSSVLLQVDSGSGYVALPMLDDGLHQDGVAGDGVFGSQIGIQSTGTLVKYYVAALDQSANAVFDPPEAPADYYAYTVGHVPPVLRINEIMASNGTIVADEFGEFEDWIEIKNPGPAPVGLAGMFVSNNLSQPTEWPLPNLVLQPGGLLRIWCDDDPAQGSLHANFKLTKTGAEIGLFDSIDHGSVLIHGFAYGLQNTDISFGYLPEDADAPEYIATPTPGVTNAGGTLFSPIVINEFLTTGIGGGVDDWVELYNRGDATVNLSNWHISDDVALPGKHTFPLGTSLAPGAHLSVDETVLGFSFSSTGSEVIMLTHADGVSGRDFFDYGPQSPEISQGRFPDGSGNWHLFSPTSRDLQNSCTGVPPTGLVSGLLFLDATTLVWSAVPGAEDYDSLRGDLGTLGASSGDFSLATTGCLENNGTDLVSWDPETPAPGQGFFYLVRSTDFSCGFGSYDSGAASQSVGRDAGIAVQTAACP